MPSAAATMAAAPTRAASAMIARLSADTTPTQAGSITKPLRASGVLSTGSTPRWPRRPARSAGSSPARRRRFPVPGRTRPRARWRSRLAAGRDTRTPAVARRAVTATPGLPDRDRIVPSPSAPRRGSQRGAAPRRGPSRSRGGAGRRDDQESGEQDQLPTAEQIRDGTAHRGRCEADDDGGLQSADDEGREPQRVTEARAPEDRGERGDAGFAGV